MTLFSLHSTPSPRSTSFSLGSFLSSVTYALTNPLLSGLRASIGCCLPTKTIQVTSTGVPLNIQQEIDVILLKHTGNHMNYVKPSIVGKNSGYCTMQNLGDCNREPVELTPQTRKLLSEWIYLSLFDS